MSLRPQKLGGLIANCRIYSQEPEIPGNNLTATDSPLDWREIGRSIFLRIRTIRSLKTFAGESQSMRHLSSYDSLFPILDVGVSETWVMEREQALVNMESNSSEMSWKFAWLPRAGKNLVMRVCTSRRGRKYSVMSVWTKGRHDSPRDMITSRRDYLPQSSSLKKRNESTCKLVSRRSWNPSVRCERYMPCI